MLSDSFQSSWYKQVIKKKNTWNLFGLIRIDSPGEDTSSELQGVISMETGGLSESRRSSFTGSGAIARLSRFVLSLTSWARRHLHHENERPDSFLERIRGPELQDVLSRDGNANSEEPGQLKK
uniref:Uncharacterized protein n=1 Tax=Sphaerodactylus townsendi TaxID=933632 RepID=A0ACB8FIU4_9SAUR